MRDFFAPLTEASLVAGGLTALTVTLTLVRSPLAFTVSVAVPAFLPTTVLPLMAATDELLLVHTGLEALSVSGLDGQRSRTVRDNFTKGNATDFPAVTVRDALAGLRAFWEIIASSIATGTVRAPSATAVAGAPVFGEPKFCTQ